VTGEVEILFSDEYPQFIIRTKEAGILIGENGQNLMAFNCLLKKIAENEFKKRELEKISFLLDVNDYQTKKIEELKNLARMNAQRARYFKKEIIMDPMNAYERRIIHTALTEYPDLETKSIGEDPDRRVVIKPFLC
jgi:spoIIIJ-associated protein